MYRTRCSKYARSCFILFISIPYAPYFTKNLLKTLLADMRLYRKDATKWIWPLNISLELDTTFMDFVQMSLWFIARF